MLQVAASVARPDEGTSPGRIALSAKELPSGYKVLGQSVRAPTGDVHNQSRNRDSNRQGERDKHRRL
jgi:hypothetical protein